MECIKRMQGVDEMAKPPERDATLSQQMTAARKRWPTARLDDRGIVVPLSDADAILAALLEQKAENAKWREANDGGRHGAIGAPPAPRAT